MTTVAKEGVKSVFWKRIQGMNLEPDRLKTEACGTKGLVRLVAIESYGPEHGSLKVHLTGAMTKENASALVSQFEDQWLKDQYPNDPAVD